MLSVDRPLPRPLLVDLARHFGGAEVRVLQVAKALGPAACQVACLQKSPLAERLREIGFTPIEVSGSKLDPRIGVTLARAIRQGNFNVVDAHNVQTYFWAALAARGLAQRPALVATVHSSTRLEHSDRMKGRLYETITRAAVTRFDYVVTVSRYLCSELLSYHLKEDQIARVPNGMAFTRAGKQAGLEVREALGIEPDDLVIGSVGRLEPAKGYDILIPTVARLARDWPRIKCVLVGDGRQAGALKEQAQAHQLDGKVIFAGFRSDIPRLLEAFDVFTLPSRTEGIPFALLEACFCALPVVASRVGGVPEVISDGQTGLLVEAGRSDELAAAISRLLADRPLAAQMGERAAADIAEHYSLNRMIEGTWQAYAAALDRQKAGRHG